MKKVLCLIGSFVIGYIVGAILANVFDKTFVIDDDIFDIENVINADVKK